MTLRALLDWGRESLSGAGIGDGKLSAWYLLEFVTGCTGNTYLLNPDQEVPKAREQRFRELIEKRSVHVPLQYLTGCQEFMGLPFFVNEHVLIPRQDTEILVETALAYMEPGMRILDMCTGSGCILLSLLKLGPQMTGTGADVSLEALKVARRNMEALEVRAELAASDLFAEIPGSFDCIVSNPPYIPSRAVDTLMEEVRGYEPRIALDGREDGLYYYGEIVGQSPLHLKPQGMLFFEIGYDQAEAVCSLMEQDFTGITVAKDLAGLDRVVYGTLR